MFTIPKAVRFYNRYHKEGGIVFLTRDQQSFIYQQTLSYRESYSIDDTVEAYNKAIKGYINFKWQYLDKKIYMKNGIYCV